ncbi:MAG TPA: pentapeptide repeat-containing protein [Candidatus Tripitaka californicus]|uniref:pentapeptide repeat-containing protein n=3 Tax=Candidatus Tripitaka californicus TaxID=3367616 RepID=UPI0040254C56
MCNWKSKYSSYVCNEPPLEGDRDGLCILHSTRDDKDLEAFKQKVEERIEGKDSIDLKGCYFPEGFDHTCIRINYSFGVPVPVDFSEATFYERADFGGAKFSGEADFRGAKFSKWAFFGEAKFSKVADFQRATFSKEAVFIKATFSEWAVFIEATFSEGAGFSGATFSGGAYFGEAEFSERADFSRATFSEGDFVGTTFSKGANFNDAEFRKRVRFQSLELGNERRPVLLGPGSSFKYTRFLGEVVFQNVDLSHCSFLHSSIDKVDFRYCEFGKEEKSFFIFPPRKQNVLRDELEADEAVGAGLKPAPTVDELDGDEDVEKNLSETDTRFFPFTSFRVRMTKGEEKLREEKYEPVRRLYLELKRKMYGWLGRNILSLEALYWTSGYGERPKRASIVLALLVLVAFPLLLSLDVLVPPLLFSDRPFCFGNWVEDLCNSFWYSLEVATFTRVTRIGEAMHVAGWNKWILVLESIVVYVQIALFALALRRKVKR